MRKSVLAVAALALFCAIVLSTNCNKEKVDALSALAQSILQPKMDTVLNDDPRNNGIKVLVYYQSDTSTLVYDLQEVGNSSAADVFRVFLQFSEKIVDLRFENVNIAFKGKQKFVLPGDDYNVMGKDYSVQNPVYTIRTFPEKLKRTDGTNAYSKWTGGWLGVTNKQMDDFENFYKQWYLDDVIEQHTKQQSTPGS